MGFNYWWWRSTKTICCIAFYYICLFIGSLLYYPQASMLELSRGDKFLLGMHDSVAFLFFVFSVIVILNRLFRKKTWFSSYSVLFTYCMFSISHFVFLVVMQMVVPVDFTTPLCVFVFFFILALWVGKLFIKPEKCVKFENDEDVDMKEV